MKDRNDVTIETSSESHHRGFRVGDTLAGHVLLKGIHPSAAGGTQRKVGSSLGPGLSPSLASMKKSRGAGVVVLQENWTQAN